VKLALEGYTYRSIAQIIGCSPAFISKWKNAFEFGGIEGLKSRYKGSSGYLNPREREKIIDWLIEKEAWDITELESHVLEVYDVVFKSRQSYYWEDICGYLWNFIKNPLKIPLKNPRERQTYYGALDLLLNVCLKCLWISNYSIFPI
jgi:transposase